MNIMLLRHKHLLSCLNLTKLSTELSGIHFDLGALWKQLLRSEPVMNWEVCAFWCDSYEREVWYEVNPRSNLTLPSVTLDKLLTFWISSSGSENYNSSYFIGFYEDKLNQCTQNRCDEFLINVSFSGAADRCPLKCKFASIGVQSRHETMKWWKSAFKWPDAVWVLQVKMIYPSAWDFHNHCMDMLWILMLLIVETKFYHLILSFFSKNETASYLP